MRCGHCRLSDVLVELGLAGARVATAVNGDFVPVPARAATRRWPKAIGSRWWRPSREVEMKSFYGVELGSRLMLGTAQYPSPAVLAEAFRASGAAVATVSLRREAGAARTGQGFWELVRELGVRVLPNTAGCHSVKEAVTTAQMAREVFGTPWIKLEVIGHTDTLQPDVFALVEAARILSADGFQVFPYTTEDLVVAEKLLDAGCEVLMPWGAPIGSGLGLNNTTGCARCAPSSRRFHWSSMPASACRATRRGRWRSAWTPCC